MHEKQRLLEHYDAPVGLNQRGENKTEISSPVKASSVTTMILINKYGGGRCYLGCIMAKDGGANSDIATKIKILKILLIVWISQNNDWRSTQISRHLELKLYS